MPILARRPNGTITTYVTRHPKTGQYHCIHGIFLLASWSSGLQHLIGMTRFHYCKGVDQPFTGFVYSVISYLHDPHYRNSDEHPPVPCTNAILRFARIVKNRVSKIRFITALSNLVPCRGNLLISSRVIIVRATCALPAAPLSSAQPPTQPLFYEREKERSEMWRSFCRKHLVRDM